MVNKKTTCCTESGATWVLENLHGMPVLIAIIILTGIASRDFFFYPFNIEVREAWGIFDHR